MLLGQVAGMEMIIEKTPSRCTLSARIKHRTCARDRYEQPQLKPRKRHQHMKTAWSFVHVLLEITVPESLVFLGLDKKIGMGYKTERYMTMQQPQPFFFASASPGGSWTRMGLTGFGDVTLRVTELRCDGSTGLAIRGVSV